MHESSHAPFAGRAMEISKSFVFDAAHRLPNVPAGHRCANMHGHTYTVTVFVAGPIGAHTGWVVDFADIKAAVKPLVDRLDHQTLNEIEGLENPTAEHIALWLFDRAAAKLPGLSAITVEETPTCTATYRPAASPANASAVAAAREFAREMAVSGATDGPAEIGLADREYATDALPDEIADALAGVPVFARTQLRWHSPGNTVIWRGIMSEAQRDELLAAAKSPAWKKAVDGLFERARRREGDDIIGRLEFRHEPLANVLARLGRQFGLNIVCKADLSGRVTMVLENVPVMVALGAILETHGFAFDSVRNPLPGGRPLLVVVPAVAGAK